MVRIHPDPPGSKTGAVAQLGERLLCKQEVVGSIPSSSTIAGNRGQGTGNSNHAGPSFTYRLHASTQQWTWVPSPVLRAAVFFNNLEGKGSSDLMRVG